MAYKDKEKQREYQRKWISARRQEWIDENGPCTKCGLSDDPEVDHINKEDKSLTLSAVWGMNKDNPKRIAELAKCQVLCHDCHKEKSISEQRRKIHGTHTMYSNYGCRCELCRVSNATKARNYRKRK